MNSKDSNMAQAIIQQAVGDWGNPSTIFRPKLSLDGDQWCALYGDNLQSGVAGFGDSPALAMADFDRAWHTPIKAKDRP